MIIDGLDGVFDTEEFVLILKVSQNGNGSYMLCNVLVILLNGKLLTSFCFI